MTKEEFNKTVEDLKKELSGKQREYHEAMYSKYMYKNMLEKAQEDFVDQYGEMQTKISNLIINGSSHETDSLQLQLEEAHVELELANEKIEELTRLNNKQREDLIKTEQISYLIDSSKILLDGLGEVSTGQLLEYAFSLIDERVEPRGARKVELFIKSILIFEPDTKITQTSLQRKTACNVKMVKYAMDKYEEEIRQHNLERIDF